MFIFIPPGTHVCMYVCMYVYVRIRIIHTHTLNYMDTRSVLG